jgi:uncharacterized repeat protein (TIGR03847 family)
MTGSFDLPDLSSFLAGTEGTPGARVFYLQAHTEDHVISLRLEKNQVALLADTFEALLHRHGLAADAHAEMAPLTMPVVAEWVVGSLAIAVDENLTHFLVIAEELLIGDEEFIANNVPHEARFGLRREQVQAFISGARGLIAAGRPTCTLCHGPINPEGHACPRLN